MDCGVGEEIGGVSDGLECGEWGLGGCEEGGEEGGRGMGKGDGEVCGGSCG